MESLGWALGGPSSSTALLSTWAHVPIHQANRSQPPGLRSHGNTWSQGHVSGAGCVRAGPFISNIYNFCLGSCFLNSCTAIQISHDFNEILDLIMVDNHFKCLHNLFITKNSLSFIYYYFIELEMFHWILTIRCSWISK